MPRVLHCIPTMGGGGAERQLAYLAGDLTALGWDVHVAFVHDGPNRARLAAGGATLHPLPASRNRSLAIFQQLRRLLRETRPDLVQTWMRQMDVFAGAAAWRDGVPWILSERSSATAHRVLGTPGGLANPLRAWMAARARGVISNSRDGDEYWRQRLPDRVRRWVIASGFPLAEIDAAAPAWIDGAPAARDAKRVLYAGRFSPEKNPEGFIAALPHVAGRVPISAVLCGEGPLRSTIERLLERSSVAALARLPGYVSPVWGLMKGADVFVSVSFFEGHPNTVSESMVCGSPLVLSDIPAHRAIVDENGALFVDPRRPDQIADAIVHVLTRPEEAAERARVARSRASGWSIPAMVRAHDAAYRELISRPTRLP